MQMQAVAASAAATADTGTTPQPRLVRAAHEFEAQMMKEMMKPMTGSNSLTGEEDDSSLGSGGALGEFASEALGKA
jgi:Rod binding domain-containing protein